MSAAAMTNSLEPAQQIAAKVAGLAYLITFATVVYVNFGIHDRLISNDGAQTARNILAHERLFRIGIAGDLIYCVGGAEYLRGFEPERLQALASLHLATRFDYYYVGLLFGSLASTVCGYLWFKSRYIPRALAAFGVISSAFCVACTFVFYIFPHFDKIVNLWWFDTPMGIFDIALSFWLLFKGIRTPVAGQPLATR
jgi:hypothetical protein